jgi:hypothetical protein
MQIRCPECGKVFDLSGSDADEIRQQIRNHELEKEVKRRVDQFKETQDAKQELAVKEAVSKEREKYMTELESARRKQHDAEMQAKTEKESSQIRLDKAVLETEKKFTEQLSEKDAEIKAKTVEAEYYRDLKARMSTKMVGESLEQHCHDEFEKLRATAFRFDYFEKDNEVSSSGSKGDFVYRAYTPDKMELVSIMFEMKNEMETTEKKHKNEDFFKELDKDRREKGCEYAVLVTMLEADSELYNQGIVDVSHRYEKMYVIRPQFFIPFITMIRNEAARREDMTRQLATMAEQNVDVLNLRNAIEAFKSDVGTSFGHFSTKYQEAMDDIDKAIVALQKTKEAMRLALKHLDTTQRKVDRIEVKKLVKDAPGLAAQLEE